MSDMLGRNRRRQPFQMGTAQAPSPVVGTSGGFQPTSNAATQALMNAMAQRRQMQQRIRFA